MEYENMKTIVAGGRDYRLSLSDYHYLDTLGITEVVSGGARGADEGGEAWARSRGIPVKRFPADWRRYGKSAGMIRNGEMADYAERLVAFPGGRGTQNMVEQALERGLPVLVVGDWCN